MARGSNMDPTHHEKIVDKLMQYRGKIPQAYHMDDDYARYCLNVLKHRIDKLIICIDRIAKLEDKGLIK